MIWIFVRALLEHNVVLAVACFECIWFHIESLINASTNFFLEKLSWDSF